MGRLETWVASTLRGYAQADHRLHEVLFSRMPVSSPVRTGVGVAPNPEAGAFNLKDPATTGLLLYAARHGATDGS